jgi:4-amino-4-deoxychorismate lyase
LKDSDFPAKGLYKCRIVYDSIAFEFEYEPYQPKSIQSLRLVESNEINYSHKYENRDKINELFNLRGSHDDILIAKNGFITDSSFANIVFQKNNQWFTPDSPLLRGTMRQLLLDSGVISLTSIRKNDIADFENFKLINSMLEWDAPSIETSKIIIE